MKEAEKSKTATRLMRNYGYKSSEKFQEVRKRWRKQSVQQLPIFCSGYVLKYHITCLNNFYYLNLQNSYSFIIC